VDSPWRRLLWTLPAASVLTLSLVLAFLQVLALAPREEHREVVLDARLVQVAGPPKALAPPQASPPVPPPPARPRPKPAERPPPRPKPRVPSKPVEPVAEPSPTTPPARTASAPPATEQSSAAVGHLGKGRIGAHAIYEPTPRIPDALRHRTIDALAVARFDVAPDGTAQVALVQPTQEPDLNRALLEALRRWKFFPALENGRPVASSILIRIPISVQ
jgi:periplasmic protein TonB